MRKIIILLMCCTVALLLGYSGYRGYRVWKQNHWMSLAKQFAAKSDVRNEVLSLRQVLNSNPRNVAACRMMANLAEAARSREALILRQRVLELNPNSVDDRLALAQTAMTFNDYSVATNALAGVSGAGKNTVAYHNLAGVIALAGRQPDLAEAEFIEASRLDPGNPAIAVNLAVVRLHGTNTLDMEEARIALTRVSMNPTNLVLRCQAERELIADAMRNKDFGKALTLSQELVQQTNSIFSDRLLRLEVLMETKNAEFKPALVSYQREAATDPAKLYQLTNWQMTRTSPAAALAWLQSLPVSVQTNQPAALMVAECQTLAQDWNGLQTFLQNQNWAGLEFIRHAFMTRALRGQNLNEAAKAEWNVALKMAGGQRESPVSQKAKLKELLRLAVQWKWQPESEDILWTMVNQYPEDQLPVQLLNQLWYGDGQTRLLMQLYSLQSTRFPSNFSWKNNLAMTALLLNAQEFKPYDLAAEIYQKSPTNSDFVSTYAFSLYLQGKNAEALKAIEQLNPRQLEEPSIAGYYGVILKAAGDPAKAGTYLNLTLDAYQQHKVALLPEEQALFKKAKAGN